MFNIILIYHPPTWTDISTSSCRFHWTMSNHTRHTCMCTCAYTTHTCRCSNTSVCICHHQSKYWWWKLNGKLRWPHCHALHEPWGLRVCVVGQMHVCVFVVFFDAVCGLMRQRFACYHIRSHSCMHCKILWLFN